MAVRRLSRVLLSLALSVAVGLLLTVFWTDISDSLRVTGRPLVAAKTLSQDLTPMPVLNMMDYKKLPQWSFDDWYRRDRLPSKTTQKCSSSLWSLINRDPELRGRFIPDVRLFVHNGSISMSEWNRLSHFNSPFGFMNYTYHDVVPALNLIPKPRVPLLVPKPGKVCISCAVVATGGVLWRSRRGREIDSHDHIFRVNGAVTKGFEDDVGSRTDVYVHTSFSLAASVHHLRRLNFKQAPHDEGTKYVLIPEGPRDFKWLVDLHKRQKGSHGVIPWRLYHSGFNETHLYVLHMDFLRLIRNRFLKSNLLNFPGWAILRPTNGAFTMFLALQLCDRVDAYGFITEDHKHYSNYYYERGANTGVIFFSNHDYNREKQLWKKLHQRSIIHLYQGEARKEPGRH